MPHSWLFGSLCEKNSTDVARPQIVFSTLAKCVTCLEAFPEPERPRSLPRFLPLHRS